MEEGDHLSVPLLKQAKVKGFTDVMIASLTGKTEEDIRALRKKSGIVPSFKIVDTCAAEFDAKTNYFYSTYLGESDGDISRKEKNAPSSSAPRSASVREWNLITAPSTAF